MGKQESIPKVCAWNRFSGERLRYGGAFYSYVADPIAHTTEVHIHPDTTTSYFYTDIAAHSHTATYGDSDSHLWFLRGL